MSISHSPLHIFLIVILLTFQGRISRTSAEATFTIINRCSYTVFPATLSGSSSPTLETTGFQLNPGESRSLHAPPNWSGRFWGRTGCNPNAAGHLTCATGDCGSGQLECNGAGAIPPATLAEFTVGSGSNNLPDFYDVSLVDGFNLPMMIEPSGGSVQCSSTGCAADLNQACPNELKAADGLGCRSACESFGTPEYCCSGAYATPDTCKPSVYSELFKTACPKAYSYAYDDGTSTFTCSGADYTITFCPSSTTTLKSSTPTPPDPTIVTPSLPAQTPPTPTQQTLTVPATYIGDGGLMTFTGDASAMFIASFRSLAMVAASSILLYFVLV